MATRSRKALPSRLSIQIGLLVALSCLFHLAQNSVISPLPTSNSSTTINESSVPPKKIGTMSAVVPIIKVVNEDVAGLGEGPYWDAQNNHLYYVDAFVGDFCRLNVVTKELVKINLGDLVTMIIPYRSEPGSFIVSKRHQVLKLNWDIQSTTVVATVAPELEGRERFNDAKADARGRLFIGSVLDSPAGVVAGGGNLYRLDGNEFTRVGTGYTISNGMAWSNDDQHSKFYFNDSEGRKIYVFDYDIETGTPSNQRVLIDCAQSDDFVDGEYPDGMNIDEYGFLWVSMYAGGRIVKIDVDTARVVDQVKFATAGVPSSLARGFYEGRDGYYITTGQSDTNPKPDDGKILHVSFQGADVNTFVP